MARRYFASQFGACLNQSRYHQRWLVLQVPLSVGYCFIRCIGPLDSQIYGIMLRLETRAGKSKEVLNAVATCLQISANRAISKFLSNYGSKTVAFIPLALEKALVEWGPICLLSIFLKWPDSDGYFL